jgi:hypothetical protein
LGRLDDQMPFFGNENAYSPSELIDGGEAWRIDFCNL